MPVKVVSSGGKSISGASVRLSKSSYSYNGDLKKPSVTVKYSGKKLAKGTHYTVAYSNNKWVGTGKVTITGKGSYYGSVKKTFKITSPGKVNVTFYNGNTKIKKVGYYRGKTYGSLPAYPYEDHKGYNFKGWYTANSGGNKVTDSTHVTKSKAYKIYAHMQAHKYTIMFNANSGTGTVSSMTGVVYGKYVTLNANKFKRAGYIFKGWSKTKTGAVSYKDKVSVKNLSSADGATVTLYAVWEKMNIVDFKSIGYEDKNVFNALCTGTISAIKNDGKWYYGFTTGSKTVYVLITDFMRDSNNDMATVNSRLSSIDQSGNSKTSNYIYHSYTSSNSSVIIHNDVLSATDKTNMTDYTHSLMMMEFGAAGTNDYVEVQCKLISDSYRFVYSTAIKKGDLYVLTDGGSDDSSQAELYKKALVRMPESIGGMEVVPKYTIYVADDGDKDVHFDRFTLDGVGVAKKDIGSDLRELIDLWVSMGKFVYEPSLSGALSLMGTEVPMERKSAAYPYGCSETYLKFTENRYCYGFSVESPVILKNISDVFNAKLYLGKKTPAGPNDNARFAISVSL